MALWVVTYEGDLGALLFTAQDVDSEAGREALHGQIDEAIDGGATAVHLTPSL